MGSVPAPPCSRNRLVPLAAVAVLACSLLALSAAARLTPRFEVKTISPTGQQVVTGKILWTIAVQGRKPSRVDFAIDGVVSWRDRRPPYRRYVDTSRLGRGKHTLRATAYAKGLTLRRTTAVSIIVDTPSVYWGAYMDGNDTYTHVYGGRWRDAPWDARTWHRFEANAGKSVCVVHWGMPAPWRREFSAHLGTFDLVREAGAINAVDISTGGVPLRDIAAGKYDSSIRSWMRKAAEWGHAFFLLLDVEMNGRWLPYSPGLNGNTAADFVGMWRRIHDIADEAGATNITWVWVPNVDPFNLFTPYEELYPGDAYVDWTGLDGFNTGDRWMTFSELYSASYQKLLQLAPSKPIMISQIGSHESGGSKAEWIADSLHTQLPTYFPRVKALLWFNWRIHRSGVWWPWQIESSSSAQSAFANGIASSYYASRGGFGTLRRGSKIKPLP
jgi:hypothetical protein